MHSAGSFCWKFMFLSRICNVDIFVFSLFSRHHVTRKESFGRRNSGKQDLSLPPFGTAPRRSKWHHVLVTAIIEQQASWNG